MATSILKSLVAASLVATLASGCIAGRRGKVVKSAVAMAAGTGLVIAGRTDTGGFMCDEPFLIARGLILVVGGGVALAGALSTSSEADKQ
jgi:hypothetical protein